MEPKINIQFNQPLLPYLLELLVILQLIIPYQGWLILLVGLGGGWLMAYLWIRSLARGLDLSRQTQSGWAQVGDRLEERFSLTNHGWARALAVEVVDESNLPDYEAGRVVSVEGHTSTRWSVSAICTRRGLYTLGPTRLRVSDPLGLYSLTSIYPATLTLMVTPRIVHLPTIEVVPGGRIDLGRRQTTTYEPTVSAAGVRDYFPGASLRMIHWPTSARREALHVRLFDHNPAGDWWIFLDLDQRVQVGAGHQSTEEHAIILAASMADQGLKNGHAVGLAAYGDRLVWLPPRLNDEQRWQILRELALLAPGPVSLADLLQHAQSAFSQPASLIIITPNPATDWLTALLPLLGRGLVPTILRLDPLAFGHDNQIRNHQVEPSDRFVEFGLITYRITPDLLNTPEEANLAPERWRHQVRGQRQS